MIFYSLVLKYLRKNNVYDTDDVKNNVSTCILIKPIRSYEVLYQNQPNFKRRPCIITRI